MHVHIASLGGATESVVAGFNAVSSIDRLHLIASRDRKHSAERLVRRFGDLGIDCRVSFVGGFDFQEIVDVIYGIYGENAGSGDVRYTINITGGTNLMAAAACSTAFFIEAEIYYVMYDRGREERGEPQDPVGDRVIRIPVPKIPNVNGLGPRTREILEYVLDNDGPDLTSVRVAEAFGMSRMALKHHTDILKREGIVDVGRWERNNRLSKITLTHEGRMVAGWVKNFNRSDRRIQERGRGRPRVRPCPAKRASRIPPLFGPRFGLVDRIQVPTGQAPSYLHRAQEVEVGLLVRLALPGFVATEKIVDPHL